MSRTWHKGPPPHVGWWNARVALFPRDNLWGWWSGEFWSAFAEEYASADAAFARAMTIGASKKSKTYVEWTDYYPKNARVPRIDPRKVKT